MVEEPKEPTPQQPLSERTKELMDEIKRLESQNHISSGSDGDGGITRVYNASDSGGKKRREDTRKEAIEIIKKCDGFVLFASNKTNTCAISGMTSGELVHLVGACKHWLKKAKSIIQRIVDGDMSDE